MNRSSYVTRCATTQRLIKTLDGMFNVLSSYSAAFNNLRSGRITLFGKQRIVTGWQIFVHDRRGHRDLQHGSCWHRAIGSLTPICIWQRNWPRAHVGTGAIWRPAQLLRFLAEP